MGGAEDYNFEAHEERMRSIAKRKKLLDSTVSLMVLLLSILMVGTLAYKFVYQSRSEFGLNFGLGEVVHAPDSSRDFQASIESIQDDIKALKSLSLRSGEPVDEKFHIKVQALESRLAVIEKFILDSPDKALSIPMLRKEQEEFSKRILDLTAATTKELDRQYDLIKWAGGGAFTALFALIPFVYRRVSGSKVEA